MKEHRYDIAAFGEILIDFTFMGHSQHGQKLFAQNPGGAPANVLVCAQKLGSRTAFLGKAGKDMHGEFLRTTLEGEGVDTKGFLLDGEYFTTLAFVDLNERGERTFSFGRKPGADTQMTRDELDLDVIGQSKIFHVGSLSLTHQPARSATMHGIDAARQAGAIISYDPNYRASLWESVETAMEQMKKIIPDVMKISDEETHLLTSCRDYQGAAAELVARGVKLAVVTLGSEGCYICNREGGVVVPGFISQVVDTTGAGDAFWGGFLHGVAQSNTGIDDISLAEAAEFARFANAAASLCVEGCGAIPAMPTLQQTKQRLAKNP